MIKNLTYVIGLMSGTSLDGIDLVYVCFNTDDYKDFEIIHAKTYQYSNVWCNKLRRDIHQSEQDIKVLDIEYGVFLGETINTFINEFTIENVDFVASHGHTVFHQPEKGYTLQIGDGQQIANITKLEVIYDFRTQDVEFGGQGAPLVPVGDELLFSEYDYCLNLGGFANVSFKKGNERIAFDICAVNIVLNKLTQELGFAYDDKGELARSGDYLLALGEELKQIPFYKKQPPKSLGLEWVEEEIFPKLFDTPKKAKDLLRTFTEHTAWAIAKTFPKKASVFITGGGVFNVYLLERIKYYKELNIIIPDKKMIEFKEALIFAFLGLLKKRGEVNCLKSVTGANKDHSSGVIFTPNN